VASSQAFKPWELKDNFEVMRNDVLEIEPSVKVNEMLHKAAYREGLGFSLYSPEYKIGTHTTPVLKDYFNKTFTASRMALIGIGVDHNKLQSYAGLMNLEGGAGPTGASK